MDVTNENFNELYPQIEKEINECDFCSFDTELSGITPFREINSFDTLRTRYDKIRKNDESFLILQFGLCMFKKTKERTYSTKAYNFYLYPKSNEKSPLCKSVKFTCLNSSIEFLIKQGFDFNKTFSKGISYISKEYEETLRASIDKKMEMRGAPKSLLYPQNKDNVKDEIQKLMDEIDAFFANEQETKKEVKFTDFLIRIFIEKNLKHKYITQMRYEYKMLENKERLMIINKLTDYNENAEYDKLETEIGFSKIVWALSKSQKLLIGHNMLTDVMQTLRHFFSPLPENYDDFKSMTHSIFPNILDTKYMATLPPLKDLINNSTLGDMDKILKEEPFKKIEIEDCSYTSGDEKLHEAGYDAYLTGLCYARMLNYLQSLNSSEESVVSIYSNKLHFMKGYDVTFFDFVKAQETPNREHVFYVEHPAYWELQNLYDLFSPFGNVFVSFINSTSAFAALMNPDHAKKVASQLIGLAGREYRVYFYKTYLNQIKKDKRK